MSDPNVVISPDMGLPIPLLNDQGPNYASNVSTALTIIDSHNHETGSGVGIDLSQMYTTGDISADGYNFSNARSIQFISQPSILTGSQDVNSVYVNQNNLGFNNSNGIFVPITSGNSLAITTLLLTNFYPYAITSNYTILPTDSFNLIDVNSSGGPVTITLPIAAFITPSPVGRFYIIRDVGEDAGTNNIQINVAGGSGNTFADDGSTTFTINSNGGYVLLYTDGVSEWYTWGQNVYQGQSITMNASSNLKLNESTESFASSTLTMDGGSTFSSTGTIDLNGVVENITGAVIAVTATSETWSTSGVLEFEPGTNLSIQGGAISVGTAGQVTFAANSDAYFQGPIVLGNLTGFPFPTIPSTPHLYVNNGEIALLTSNALIADATGSLASDASGGITSHILGGITSGVDGGIALSGDTGDQVVYQTTRTDSLQYMIAPQLFPYTWNTSFQPWSPYSPSPTAAAQNNWLVMDNNQGISQIFFYMSLPVVHAGASFASIAVNFAVTAAFLGAQAPENPPTLELLYMPMNTAINPSLSGSWISLGAQPFWNSRPTAAQWVNSENLQQSAPLVPATHVISQNNVYSLKIGSASGGSFYYALSTLFASVVVNYQNITYVGQ